MVNVRGIAQHVAFAAGALALSLGARAAGPSAAATGASATASAPVKRPPECASPLVGAGRLVAEHSGYRVLFQPQPWPIATGRLFRVALAVCPPPGAAMPRAVVVDADMPAHRHGMNYRPRVMPDGPGRFRAEGLMFHMTGRWRFIFDLQRGPGLPPVRLTREVDLA